MKPPYHKFCGPAVVASALLIKRERAAEILLDAHNPWQHGKHNGRSTSIDTIAKVLGLEAVTTANVTGDDRVVRRNAAWGIAAYFPTLAQWISENKDREAIVRASNHFVHVRRGQIIEDNGLRQMRARVTHAIYLDAERA